MKGAEWWIKAAYRDWNIGYRYVRFVGETLTMKCRNGSIIELYILDYDPLPKYLYIK